jgi:hypothetical protein
MSICIHGNLCRDIYKKIGFIYDKKCPIACPYFEEKYKDNSSLKVKRVEIVLEESEKMK